MKLVMRISCLVSIAMAAATVHAFVMVPAREVQDGFLNGYRIGEYPANPPDGFIEVTKENRDTKVSPHFQLKQFVCQRIHASIFRSTS